MKFSLKQLNSSGISLVEVVASIVILAIILFSIFTLLIQSAKTTENAENVFDATYIGQQEMEKLYVFAKNTQISSLNSITNCSDSNDLCYNSLTGSDGLPYYQKQDSSNNYCIKLNFTTIPNYTHLTRALIQIYEGTCETGKLKSQMENTLEWRNP